MPRIRVLPDHVANQIAAGEVVERPASVVKELVENALDARATRIEIAIERGGKARIRVSDDGVGMVREDALLCLDRHATSKIRAAEDLKEILTLGFRGEALPSISAVSRLTIETQPESGGVGTKIRSLAGRIQGVEDVARRTGTTVDVQNLFLNTPARARFLGTVGVETRAISEVVHALALTNLETHFVLTVNDRQVLDLPAGRDLKARIQTIWNDPVVASLIPLSAKGSDLRLTGALQRPDLARPGFRRAQLFVNGRPYRDAGVLAAADRGYRTTVPQSCRAWVFLYLDVAPGQIDINVHPGKAEVRFSQRGVVEAFVEASVRETLEGQDSAATLGQAPPLQVVREGWGDTPSTTSGASGAGVYGNQGDTPSDERRVHTDPPTVEETADAAAVIAEVASPTSSAVENQISLFREAQQADLPAAPGHEEAFFPTAPKPHLLQIHNSFILAETRDGMIIVDQHAAHERILFERIMAQFDAGQGEGQRLLFPLTLRLTRQELDIVASVTSLLSQLGFEIEPFGSDAVLIQAVPSPHRYFDAERCVREMIGELAHGSDLMNVARNQNERVAMSFACKGAIKAGQRLSAEEMQELFDQLFATELPYHDVHGRPTVVRLGLKELERKFGRS